MMDSTRTISELKSAFLRGQVRILSENLEPPEDWRHYAVEINDDELPDKVIEDVLHKVNQAAKQHNRVVYSSQAIHHVANQIASLYWSSVNQEAQNNSVSANGVDRTADLSRQVSITKLPQDLNGQGSSSDENERYRLLREKLVSLDQQRQQKQRRLGQLRYLQKLLEPFNKPQENIQPNLVTRDGELAQELERMRMLVARVGGRIAQQKPRGDIQDGEYSLPGSSKRLEALMDAGWEALYVPHESAVRMKRLVGLEGGASPIWDGARDHISESTIVDVDHCSDAVDPPVVLDCAAIIEGATPSSPSKATFTRGHRRRSTHVTRRDLEKFQKEVLGVENHAAWYDEENGSSRPINPNDPQLEELNRAFARADMSMNSGPGMSGNPPRACSPGSQTNGAGMAAMNGAMPLNAGHQMDLHHLYDMVLELSEVLKNNREVTKNIVTSAEEIMKHGSSETASPAMQQVNGEITATRILELERALAKEKRLVEELKQERQENAKLIGEYEAGVGTMVEQIRNYCQNNNMHYLYQKNHYNNLLQTERDAHLESRLDRDYWHAQTMRCAEMIRTAHRLRSEEDALPIRIVAGLQNEVRAYRHALGMEPEKPEDEYGWEILRDLSSAE
ncbi:hypothetical protein N7470_009646 [Penicillium chermesinum]|nr:hypothetical protein N7470_009646 [Penicillium chermesinum]